jgi:ketosteroid isomerase-like protein
MTRLLFLLALPLLAQSPEAQIRAFRQASNTALKHKDIQAFASSLAPDFTGIRGNGAQIPSRQAYIALFQSDFANPASVRFERTPDKIEISAAAPLAAEHGHWIGTRPTGAPAFAGTYTAMWRSTPAGWQIRSELFVVLQCHDAPACASYRQPQGITQ